MKCKIFILISIGFALQVTGSDLSKNILFKLTFEDGLAPEIANGNPIPEFLGDKKLLRFGQGLGDGKGLITGVPKQAVRFKALGNIDSQKGTASFWVKGFPGVKWNFRDGNFYHFFQWINSGDNINIYKYSVNDFTRFYERGKIHYFPLYEESNWNFFVFTWSGPDLKWYLNGELVGNVLRAEPFPPVSEQSYFDIGQYSLKTGEENRVTDELIIYDRPLTRMEILSLYATVTGMPTEQLVRLTPTSRAIEIDGEMCPEEWRDASTLLIGLDTKTKSVSDTISRLYLTYDNDYLYFYLKSPIPSWCFDDPENTLLHGFFEQSITEPDHVMDADDCLDIKVQTSTGDSWYQLMVNTIDVKYDRKFSDKRSDLRWNSTWTVKTSISDDGWDLEGKIPFSDFGETPAVNTIWKMNAYRLWRKLRDQVDAWSNDRYIPDCSPQTPGKIVFGDTNNISVRISKLLALDNRAIDMELILRSKGFKVKNIVFEILADGRSLEKNNLEVHPDKDYTIKVKKNFNEKPVTRLQFRVTDSIGETTYWVQDTPVFKDEGIILNLANYPVAGKLIFNGEFPQFDLALNKTKILLFLKKGDSLMKEAAIQPTALKFEYELDTSELPSGVYHAQIQLIENSRVIAEKSFEYVKEKMPDWFGNSLGISKEVPPPWIPVKYTDDRIEVWGREYSYNNSLFPSEIKSVGDNLLASPIKVDLASSGKNLLSEGVVTVEKQDADDTQATFLRILHLEEATVQVETRIEFDGMMWNTLSIIPRQGEFKIDSLSLNIPIKKSNATLMMPHDYSLRNTGYIKPWNGSIRPVWIGNEARGITFFTEHSYNWIMDDREKEIEIIPQDQEVMLKINLVDHQAIIKQPLKLEFGLMATPVKEMRKEYRKWRIHHFPGQITREKNAKFIQMPFRKWGKPSFYETCYPVADPDMRPVRDVRNGEEWEGLLYHQLKRTWSESPEAKMFASEWTSEQRIVPKSVFSTDENPDNRQIEVCQGSKSFQDFLVAGLVKIQREVNPGGFYFDVANPKKCYNVNHGCGYVVDGEIRPTFNILGAREMIKRIYIATKEVRPDNIIAYHVSGQVSLPVHSFADLLFEGENLQSRLVGNRGYPDILTLDTYRAEHIGHNFGPAVTLLPEFKTTKDWLQNTAFATSEVIRVYNVEREWLKRREEGKETAEEAQYWNELAAHENYLLGLSLLHDNPFWVASMMNMDPVRRHYHILDRFNYAAGDHAFIPYWNQKIATTVPPGEAVVSLYISPTQAVAVVMNMSDEDMDIKLRLDVKKLGVSGNNQAVNLEYSEDVSLENDILTIKNMPSLQYRVILLDKTGSLHIGF